MTASTQRLRSTAPESVPEEANMRWLFKFVLAHRFAAFMSILSGVIAGITASLEPYLIGRIIDSVQNGVNLNQLAEGIALIIGLAVITTIAFFGQRYYSGLVAYSVHYDVRKSVFDHMVTLDQGFYSKHATGDLISRMFSDLNWVWRLMAITFTRAGSAIMNVLVIFVLLATINVPLTIVVFIALGISSFFQIRTGVLLIPLSEKVQDKAGDLTALIQDSVTGIQTIKTFGREKDVDARFYAENQAYKKEWLRYKRLHEPVGMVPQMFIQLTAGIVVIVGGAMTLREEITPGNFTQFLLYLTMIRMALLQLGTIFQRYM
ncbi:MAG: ABC transporter transmembrane domain-containing protein, partial [Aggregatilineales bacterium]